MNQTRINMKKLLEFILDQRLEDIDGLPSLIEPLKEKFNIRNKEGQEATEELINTVIFWEKHTEIYDSLEKFLEEKFVLL
jgi:hypothetical protein